MTFAAREESRSLGEPLSYYLFRYGPDSYFAYTDAETPQQMAIPNIPGTVTFTPVPIARGEIAGTGSLDRTTLDIMLDDALELCSLFALYPPSDVVTLSVYEGHAGEDEVKGVWFGRVVGYGSDGQTKARLTCEPVATSLKRPGLRRHYQRGCPLVLYGPQCRAAKAPATTTALCQAVNGGVVTLPNGWSAQAAKYAGGIAEWLRVDGRTERRTVLQSTVGGMLVLSGPALGLVPGTQVTLSLGCNHQMDDCRTLHSNILNFGGQPWIPLKNPVGLTNNYY